MSITKEVKKDLISKFSINKKDTGSAEVQIAVQTERINNLIEHFKNHKHDNHSMFVVPSHTDGIKILRPMQVYGHDDAPHGHMHISFKDVKVNKEDLLLEDNENLKQELRLARKKDVEEYHRKYPDPDLKTTLLWIFGILFFIFIVAIGQN